MNKLMIEPTAYFMKNNVKYLLQLVSDVDMAQIRHDPDTRIRRDLMGYPMYYTLSGDIYPEPIDGIEVIYG
jgi:hypothetical protein